jgi:hypothetical protein
MSAQTISVARGIGAALVLTAAGAAVLAALGTLMGPGAALRAVIALMGFAYVLYLLASSEERVGRISTVALWLCAAAAAWFAGVPLVGYVLIHAGLAWLVRSLYFAHGLLAALAELGLVMLGLAFAVWAASRSGSALLAFWCFFLVQAFHALVPAAFGRRTAEPRDEQAFTRAQRAAEAALQRMSALR